MSTIWRPNLDRLYASVAEMEGSESEEEEKDATKKGVKRKRAPHTKGPCEHGVKYRSNCKVCSACPHGKRRSQCKDCGGASICVHGRRRSRCKECGGSESASTAVGALGARSAVGLNLRARSSALYVQGVRWVSNLRARSSNARSARSRVTVVSALSARSARVSNLLSTVVAALVQRRHRRRRSKKPKSESSRQACERTATQRRRV